MSFVKRSIDWSIVIASGAIVLAVMYGIWCDVIDGRIYKPVLEFGSRFTGPTHHTTKSIYKPGELVYARIAMQKQRSIPGTIQWSLINHELKQYPARDGSLPAGVFDYVVPVEKIPMDAEVGEHWFCGTVRYRVNWLSTVSYSVWTNKFEVVR